MMETVFGDATCRKRFSDSSAGMCCRCTSPYPIPPQSLLLSDDDDDDVLLVALFWLHNSAALAAALGCSDGLVPGDAGPLPEVK